MRNLRDIRESLKISQTSLAEMVGCSQGAIGHYETGRRTPSLSMCRALVAALNKSGAHVEIDDVFPPESLAA
ncbi:TPA: helix-turn-helix transcriptional regulator [Serratia fonticola]|uniref:helix-turn-helix transcriptional regulator n=1 Tax=Serratia fonticola TaxID=47917 RepID=UPI003AAC5385|nr:helix-turn-helix transcriptional regulator [Serratia fonticola]HBE9152328.1 helix-turn-helix transcriptional regulator [Serratia fonticola]